MGSPDETSTGAENTTLISITSPAVKYRKSPRREVNTLMGKADPPCPLKLIYVPPPVMLGVEGGRRLGCVEEGGRV